MTGSPLLERLLRRFDDTNVRVLFHVGWPVDRAEAPLTVRITPAGWPSSPAYLRDGR